MPGTTALVVLVVLAVLSPCRRGGVAGRLAQWPRHWLLCGALCRAARVRLLQAGMVADLFDLIYFS